MSDKTEINLVAYLDGELAPSESQRIEKQLAADASVRKEVDVLSRTWDMLDELDEVQASEEFTHKTLTSIQAAKSGSIRVSPANVVKRWVTTLAICAGIVAATFFGFHATSRPGNLLNVEDDLGPRQQKEILERMDLLQNLHVYDEVDVEFAAKLHESGLFNE